MIQIELKQFFLLSSSVRLLWQDTKEPPPPPTLDVFSLCVLSPDRLSDSMNPDYSISVVCLVSPTGLRSGGARRLKSGIQFKWCPGCAEHHEGLFFSVGVSLCSWVPAKHPQPKCCSSSKLPECVLAPPTNPWPESGHLGTPQCISRAMRSSTC